MATEIRETWTCDITGEEAVQTEPFAVWGTAYEIDLSAPEVDKFERSFSYYAKRARPLPRKSEAPKSSKDKPGVQVNHGKARKWAQSNGIEVNEFGAVPKEVIDAYVQAWLKDDVPEQWR